MTLARDLCVPDRINAVMDPMQPPARDSALDHPMRQPDLEQLRYRHNPVLTGREGGDRDVETTPLRATGLKCTYTVDFPPLADHVGMVRSRGARINAKMWQNRDAAVSIRAPRPGD